jgi:hypothetical protein
VVTASSAKGDLQGAGADSGLRARYGEDAALLQLHIRKLPKPGWAGSKDATERAYIRWAKARKSPRS